MKYILLIANHEDDAKKLGPLDQADVFKEYRAFTESVQASGHMTGGDPLQPSTTATTVRVRNGKTLTTDGPFAETKEQLVGYYLVEAKDIDEAIGIAARIPGARWGSVEVRPIMPMGG